MNVRGVQDSLQSKWSFHTCPIFTWLFASRLVNFPPDSLTIRSICSCSLSKLLFLNFSSSRSLSFLKIRNNFLFTCLKPAKSSNHLLILARVQQRNALCQIKITTVSAHQLIYKREFGLNIFNVIKKNIIKKNTHLSGRHIVDSSANNLVLSGPKAKDTSEYKSFSNYKGLPIWGTLIATVGQRT